MANLKKLQNLLPSSPTCLNLFDDSTRKKLNNLKQYFGSNEDEAVFSVLSESFVDETGDETGEYLGVLSIEDDFVETGSSGLKCSICKSSFETAILLREHCKLDWHRYNAKQISLAKPPVSADEFAQQISGELSSISGSDSESDDDLNPISRKESENEKVCELDDSLSDVNAFFMKHPSKCFYTTIDKQLLAVSRNIIGNNQNENISHVHIQNIGKKLWIYLMFSAGHFAGIVFDGNKILAHKTFHRYTIRAKRGTTQAVHDKKQGGAKSVGASIRRYNESALTKETQELITSWSTYINRAEKIFYKCSIYNSHVIFDNNNLFRKDDIRCSKISGITRRPTLKEVKRIHNLFSTVEIYGPLNPIEQRIKELFPARVKIETVEQDHSHSDIDNIEKQEDENNATAAVSMNLKDKSKKKQKKTKTNLQNRNEEMKTKQIVTAEEEYVETDKLKLLWMKMYNWCQQNNLKKFQSYFIQNNIIVNEITDSEIKLLNTATTENLKNENMKSENMKSELETVDSELNTEELLLWREFFEKDYLNYCSFINGETLLHAAVKSSSNELILLLLLLGSDPCIKNKNDKLPYNITKDKDTRNEFRRFMAKYPDKYDYKNANIPSALTEEQESEQQRKNAEKKKAQNKARKERLKVKKAEERQDKLAEKEQKSFEALSDREKRAVMAERRFAAQLSNTLRCAHCRTSVSEKEAFERFDYKYCSTKCVQEHKLIIGK